MASVAESIVSFTINKIGGLAIQEAGYLYGVREKVESILADLRWMRSFLRDADRRLGQGDERVKTLVGDVWSIACRVEDTVDTFRLREERRRRRGSINKCICALSDFFSLREIGRTIEAIKKEISNISARKTTYGTAEIDGGGGLSYASTKLQDYRRATALADGKEIVGFTEDADALVERLIGVVAGDCSRRRVVSIVAQGGAGKTTLANKVYQSDQVRNHFDHSATAWVCVSLTYNAKYLLQEIAGKVLGMSEQVSKVLSERDLQEKLSNFLREKRYLIVIDDVWGTDAWDQLKAAFPDARNGSRIIITTRNERVALYADPDPANPPYQLPLLNPNDSWKLFLKKAFPWEETSNEIRSTSSELVDVGKEIVKRCGGLPLAISVVGGLLAAKGEVKVEDWKNVLSSLKAELSGESVHCGDILALSYYDLPYYLKPCFLYLGLFPEDYGIPVDRLKMLWVAEGFIQSKEGRENEDIAEDYLVELIGRSIVQVDTTEWDGSVATCRIHDLLHAFAISEGKQHNFLEIYSEKVRTPITSSTTQARWLAIHDGVACYQNRYTPNIRSLLCIDMREVNLPRHSKGLKRLRVLEFQKHWWRGPSTLNVSIGKLTYVRYLNLQDTDTYVLPPSIGNLWNLETLLLPQIRMSLPREIWGLYRLKHLDAWLCEFEDEPRVDNLKNLHTLKLASGKWVEEEKTVSSLRGLKDLMIEMTRWNIWRPDWMEGIWSLIGKLINLQSFELEGTFFASGEDAIFISLPSLQHHLHLSVLSLHDVRLERLPQLPPTLTKLSLRRSQLHDDPMPTLETLANLRALHLAIDSYTRKKMISSAQGFPQLKYLIISDLHELEELVLEQGAMPKLEKLCIHYCRNLNKLSEGLRCVTTLKKFSIINASRELSDWLQKAEEEGWYKNQNVTRIATSPIEIMYRLR